jgi:hypothetical protein
MPHRTTSEAADLLRSALSRNHRSKIPSASSAVKVMVVVVVEAVVIGEAVNGLLHIFAELTSTPSWEL